MFLTIKSTFANFKRFVNKNQEAIIIGAGCLGLGVLLWYSTKETMKNIRKFSVAVGNTLIELDTKYEQKVIENLAKCVNETEKIYHIGSTI